MSVAKALSAQFIKTLQLFAVVFTMLMVWACMPAPAHAAGLTEIQMQAVINLLSSFGTDQKTLNNVTEALRGSSRNTAGEHMSTSSNDRRGDDNDNEDHFKTSFPGASACGFLMRTLSRGHSGEDVRMLQEFLRKTGDLNATSTTNYFGAITEAALKAWQARTGLVIGGDAASTGFGMVGPKTRQMLMQHCKDLVENRQNGENNHGDNHGTSTNNNTTLMCVLRANKSPITVGESVTLTWESRNATSASTVTGSTTGPVSGSIVMMPTQTTTFLKRVYGPAGQAECMTTVIVGTTTPVVEKKLVLMPGLQIGRALSFVTSGMAAVMDGYLSLFGLALE